MLRSLVLRSIMLSSRMQRANMPRVPMRWVVAFFSSSAPHLVSHVSRR